MPIICRACNGLIADDAAFCGYCGFKVAPLPLPDEPILLTKVKRKSEEVRAEAARPRRAPETGPARHTEPPVRQAPPTSPTTFPPRAPRFPLKVDVTYNSEHNFYTGFMENICEGGLFIATHDPASLGDHVEVTFTVPGLQRECTVVCRVRWLREYDPHNPDVIPGMGCQFGALDTCVAAAIQAFIEHRDPIFFD